MNIWLSGGTEKVLESVVSCLKKEDFRTKIYLYLINPLDKSRYRVPESVILVEGIKNLYQLRKLENKTVINFSGYWKSGAVCFFLFRKYISWCHNNPFILKKARSGSINFLFLKKSRKLICICNEQKEILQRTFNFKTDIEMIYNAIDIKAIEKKASEPIPINFKYILMPARFELAQKDFITLIDAYSFLDEEIKNIYKLLLVGTGPDEEYVKNYVKNNNLQDNVYFIGYDENPYKWIKNAELCVLCSNYEGFSVVVMEIMANKKPLILTNFQTGAKEVSNNEKNVAIVPIGDAKTLSRKMKEILEDKQYAQSLSINSYKYAIDNFGIETFNRKIISLMENYNE